MVPGRQKWNTGDVQLIAFELSAEPFRLVACIVILCRTQLCTIVSANKSLQRQNRDVV